MRFIEITDANDKYEQHRCFFVWPDNQTEEEAKAANMVATIDSDGDVDIVVDVAADRAGDNWQVSWDEYEEVSKLLRTITGIDAATNV